MKNNKLAAIAKDFNNFLTKAKVPYTERIEKVLSNFFKEHFLNVKALLDVASSLKEWCEIAPYEDTLMTSLSGPIVEPLIITFGEDASVIIHTTRNEKFEICLYNALASARGTNPTDTIGVAIRYNGYSAIRGEVTEDKPFKITGVSEYTEGFKTKPIEFPHNIKDVTETFDKLIDDYTVKLKQILGNAMNRI